MNAIKTSLISVLLLGLQSQITIGQTESAAPKVTRSVFSFKSKPIREMNIVIPGEHKKQQRTTPNKFRQGSSEWLESNVAGKKPVIQKTHGHRQGRGPTLNFEGIGNVNAVIPADPNGDVGLNHYVQTVNSSFAIWDKNGSLLYGPVDNMTIWESFPGQWNTYSWTDAIFKYDQFSDRWLIISWAFNFTDNYTMIAVSTSPDPLGSYYCYAYHHSEIINDYPKVSIWPDGYYLTYSFWDTATYLYPVAAVVDRDVMLIGAAEAEMILFPIISPVNGFYFPLSADIKGTSVPVDEPCWVVSLGRQDTLNQLMVSLDIYAFETNWVIPENSTFNLISSIEIGEYPPIFDFGPGAPQPGNPINLMTIPWFLMYPLTYRMFSDHEKLVCCNTIWDGDTHFIKWYELRKQTTEWFLYQSGNYAPGNAHYFFPSISVNGNGDIALGYSISSETIYPSIRFTGRRAEDLLGTMTFQELQLFHGLNYSNSYDLSFEQNRWGDYSSLMVDPSDDSTFWYTNMYTDGAPTPGNWRTRIFSLNLSGDTALPYAFAGNDTLAYNVLFFETQGEAENYSSILWTTNGDGIFITNFDEHVTYLRGQEDLANGQVILTMHITGYYEGTETADSVILYLSPVGKEDPIEKEKSLHLYPNPTQELITLQAEVLVNEPLIVDIIGGEGKSVFTGRYFPVVSQFELQFDISYLPSGIYFVKLQTNEGTKVSKFVVQKR